MSFTYLASPYSHPDPAVRLKRFERVARKAAELMLAGESVFCPITHSHPIDLVLPQIQGHDFWMRQDVPILRHAGRVKVLMLEGWQSSKGIAHEVNLAHELHIPVEFITDDEPEPLDDVVRRGHAEIIDDE